MTMTKSKWTAIRLTVEGLLVVVFIVLAVGRYEQELLAINWKLVSIACVAVAGAFAIYRWQMRGDNEFDMLDVVATGPEKHKKLDTDKLYKAIFAGVALWVIVQQALVGREVTALVLGVLGFFIAKGAVDGFSDAMKARGAPVSQDVNIQRGAQVGQVSATAPAQPAAQPAEEASQYHAS